MNFQEALRRADEMRLPDLRMMFIQPYIRRWEGEVPPCCAIGGAAVASGDFKFELEDFTLQLHSGGQRLTRDSERTSYSAPSCSNWEDVARKVDYAIACPATPCPDGYRSNSLYELVVHLYDDHEWSRTQIADYFDAYFEADRKEVRP